MARVQVYPSDEVAEKINMIVEKRKAEGAKDKDISFAGVATMLLELGLRVYEAEMERKESSFNQTEYNKTILENIMKTQFTISKGDGPVDEPRGWGAVRGRAGDCGVYGYGENP